MDTGHVQLEDDQDQDQNNNFAIPNSVFRPARILVNPRCVTTYAGVSHAQLARDLFGPPEESNIDKGMREKYVLDDWEGAPESFVCQEQRYVIELIPKTTRVFINISYAIRYTGGRTAPKTQRRLGFSIHAELDSGL